MMATSDASVPPEGSDSSTQPVSLDTKSKQNRPSNKNASQSSTQGCPPLNNPTTCPASSSTYARIYLTNIPDPAKKSATSDPASTSRDPDFYEYWDSSKKVVYNSLLWLPETGSPGLVSSSLSGSVLNSGQNSSFKTVKTVPQKKSSEKTSWPSFKYTVVDGTGDEGTGKKTKQKYKTIKIKLNPTGTQKQKLTRMAGCARYTYNKAVALRLQQGSTHTSKYRLRDRLVTAKTRKTSTRPVTLNNFFANKAWLLECPKSIRHNAVEQACANVKACFSNLRAKNITHFTPPYRTKKRETTNGWALEMDRANVKRCGAHLFIFPDILGEMKYHGTKQLQKFLTGVNPTHDCKVQKTEFNEYFLVLSLDVKPKTRPEVRALLNVQCDDSVALQLSTTTTTVAVDPGVRKTMTTYSPELQESFMLGKGQATDIYQLLLKYSTLQSSMSKALTRDVRRVIQSQMCRVRKRIFNLKKEFRDQVANFMARRYDIVLLPKLDTNALSIRPSRKLTTKVVRQMLSLGHSRLFEHIQEKVQEHGGTCLTVKEHYTSQTCVNCGQLNKCDETYRCSKCGFECDRDIVGAAGIFLKAVRTKKPRKGWGAAPIVENVEMTSPSESSNR